MPRARRANIGRRSRQSNATALNRRSQSEEDRVRRNEMETQRHRRRNQSVNSEAARNRRGRTSVYDIRQMERAAFNYDATIDYSMHAYIGQMNIECIHCKAFKFRNETPGMCCAAGKVKLPVLEPPPEPLHSLIFGNSPTSQHFLLNIQKYNSCFQMTSFGATNIIRDGFMPTFKVITSLGMTDIRFNLCAVPVFDVFRNSDTLSPYISQTLQIQGQLYHRAGSLLPFPDGDHQFLQIYFIGDENCELNRRCAISTNTRRSIVNELQTFFHQHNELVKLFKVALDRMPTDGHKIIIKADKTPIGEHVRRFNVPTIDEVAIFVVGEQFRPRDIVLYRRNEQLQRISELHRCYDALQYPILFWRGDDGYHINIPMINPTTGTLSFDFCLNMIFKSFSLTNYFLHCRSRINEKS